MKNKIAVIGAVGLMLGCMSLQAANTLVIASGQNALTGTTFSGPEGDISPYTGTLVYNGVSSSVKLYCDDANNTVSLNTSWDITATQVGTSADGTATRFGDVNGAPKGTPNANDLDGTSIPVPTGTTLYEEEAWLFTQMMANPTNTTVLTSAQEAAWEFTDDTDKLSSDASNVATWMEAAYNAVTGSGASVSASTLGLSSYTAATYSDWYVFTDSTGCGGASCADNTTSSGEQEFLAYFSGGSSPGSGGSTGTPEPATFWLLGSALVFVGFRARRKVAVAKI